MPFSVATYERKREPQFFPRVQSKIIVKFIFNLFAASTHGR